MSDIEKPRHQVVEHDPFLPEVLTYAAVSILLIHRGQLCFGSSVVESEVAGYHDIDFFRVPVADGVDMRQALEAELTFRGVDATLIDEEPVGAIRTIDPELTIDRREVVFAITDCSKDDVAPLLDDTLQLLRVIDIKDLFALSFRNPHYVSIMRRHGIWQAAKATGSRLLSAPPRIRDHDLSSEKIQAYVDEIPWTFTES